MVNKDYCDECKKEIETDCLIRLSGFYTKKRFWINRWEHKDFCSIKCLKKFIKTLKEDGK